MIFHSPEVRERFHLFPVDRQRDLTLLDLKLQREGEELELIYADPETLELSFRFIRDRVNSVVVE